MINRQQLFPAAIARACFYALQFGLITCRAVRDWGDRPILANEDPPTWTIDLADCHRDNVYERLRRVPGDARRDAWEPLLCGLVAIRWHEGRLPIDALRRIGWELYLADGTEDTRHWGLELECIADGYEGGCNSLTDLKERVMDAITAFGEYRSLVPDWMAGDVSGCNDVLGSGEGEERS